MTAETALNLKQLDSWIREGRAVQVRALLPGLVVSEIQRSDLIEYADLARRVQMPELIIRWLRPLIRSEKPVFPAASVKERALYALALSRIGIFKEATTLLKELRSSREPQVFYYLGLIGIEQWDFMSAFSPLKTYVKSAKISEYQRLVGLLNLAACYVGLSHFDRANETLEQLLALTEKPDLKLLRANTLELYAQSMIFSRKLQEARSYLTQASELIGNENFQYEFFIRKWQAIVTLFDSENKTEELDAIRAEASRGQFFETVRECDFFKAVVLQNKVDFLKVYFGSHFRAYKARMLRLYDWRDPVPNKIDFMLNAINSSSDKAFQFDPDEIRMPKLVRALLRILLSDTYRPFSLTEIFGQIYEKEYFNPHTSIEKMNQLICRLRKVFAENNIPLKLQVSDGRASLIASGSLVIQLKRKKKFVNPKVKNNVYLLEQKFGNKKFSSADASQTLGLSERSARRFLVDAVRARKLRREMASRGYHYAVILTA